LPGHSLGGWIADFPYSLHLERGDDYTIRSVLETLAANWEKLDGKLGLIAAPTLILWGEHDRITPVAMVQIYHRGIARSELCTIHSAGTCRAWKNRG
jgi:pimeloyl-ACP methyl ester carboxylesterase